SELALDQVEILPAGHPWQRAPLRAAGSHRRRMIDLAIAGDPRLAVNPIELERDGPTYTIDTLKALPQDAKYVWLLGADQLANFCTWRQCKEIVRYVDLAVSSRPDTSLGAPVELLASLHDSGSPAL